MMTFTLSRLPTKNKILSMENKRSQLQWLCGFPLIPLNFEEKRPCRMDIDTTKKVQ